MSKRPPSINGIKREKRKRNSRTSFSSKGYLFHPEKKTLKNFSLFTNDFNLLVSVIKDEENYEKLEIGKSTKLIGKSDVWSVWAIPCQLNRAQLLHS